MFRPRFSLKLFMIFIALFFPASYCPGSGSDALSRLSLEDEDDLTQLSLEDLMDIKITSVSKKPQRLSEATAAVFVITREDIRRSGVTSIPEALRMVPGLQVAKIDANKWAVTARGSNGRFANKLLVLMDGRSVYTPLYSGVFWENIDTVLEDIDRIEVIRGPGASLWGANAVNGVINIITKPSDKTQGVLVSSLAGSEERGVASLRYGGTIGEETPFRIYFKGYERDAAVDASGDQTADDGRYLRGGFRLDHQNGGRNHLMLQGGIFDGTNGETIILPTLTPPYNSTLNNDNKEEGYHLISRWRRTLNAFSEISLQTYYDHKQHVLHLGTAEVDTFDVELQHRFSLGTFHDITWGGGYRFHQDDFSDRPPLTNITPSHRNFNIANAFLQDEIGFLDNHLHLTLGSKFEYNDYTQWEIQPSARLLWRPDEKRSVWASVSRAVRTPSRVERDADVIVAVLPPETMGPLPVTVNFYGSDDFDSEELTAYELGYRRQVGHVFTLDAALYYNVYRGLRQTATGVSSMVGSPPAYIDVPVSATNNTRGQVYGFELAVDWRAAEWLHFQPAYTFMENQIDYSENDILAAQDPRHQFSLRTAINFFHDLEFDLWYRHVDRVSDTIDGYDTIDARLGWRYGQYLEFSITGQNLLESHHPEIQPEALHNTGTEVQRGVYGKVVWKFN